MAFEKPTIYKRNQIIKIIDVYTVSETDGYRDTIVGYFTTKKLAEEYVKSASSWHSVDTFKNKLF